MNIFRYILFSSIFICNAAYGCGDNRESFKTYANTAEHIVLAGVVSMRQDAYGKFIAEAAESYDVKKGLPIDISRYSVDFDIKVLHKYKGQSKTLTTFYQKPCYGKVDLGGLYVIFAFKTEFGFEAVTYNAYSSPEIIEYLNKSINKKSVVDAKDAQHN